MKFADSIEEIVRTHVDIRKATLQQLQDVKAPIETQHELHQFVSNAHILAATTRNAADEHGVNPYQTNLRELSEELFKGHPKLRDIKDSFLIHFTPELHKLSKCAEEAGLFSSGASKVSFIELTQRAEQLASGHHQLESLNDILADTSRNAPTGKLIHERRELKGFYEQYLQAQSRNYESLTQSLNMAGLDRAVVRDQYLAMVVSVAQRKEPWHKRDEKQFEAFLTRHHVHSTNQILNITRAYVGDTHLLAQEFNAKISAAEGKAPPKTMTKFQHVASVTLLAIAGLAGISSYREESPVQTVKSTFASAKNLLKELVRDTNKSPGRW